MLQLAESGFALRLAAQLAESARSATSPSRASRSAVRRTGLGSLLQREMSPAVLKPILQLPTGNYSLCSRTYLCRVWSTGPAAARLRLIAQLAAQLVANFDFTGFGLRKLNIIPIVECTNKP